MAPPADAAAGKDAAAAPKDATAKDATGKDAAAAGGQRQRGQNADPTQMASGGGRGGNNAFGGGTGGRGGQGGGNRAPLTPEQQKQMAAINADTKLTPEQKRTELAKLFPNMGGGRGGQGGGRGGRNGAPQGPVTGIAERGATNIDQLLPAVQRRETPNQRVWIFVKDAAGNGQLKPINALRTGISDGQTTELVTGELKEGDKVVTNFIIPGAQKTGAPNQQQQQGNPFQQQGGRGGPGGGGGGRGGGF